MGEDSKGGRGPHWAVELLMIMMMMMVLLYVKQFLGLNAVHLFTRLSVSIFMKIYNISNIVVCKMLLYLPDLD